MSKDRDQIKEEFLADAGEMLDSLESRLIALESAPAEDGTSRKELLDGLFRVFHTIKGTAGFFDLRLPVTVCHEAETLLDVFRGSRDPVTSDYIDLFMDTRDFLARLFQGMAEGRDDSGMEQEAKIVTRKLASAVRSLEGDHLAPVPGAPENQAELSSKPRKKRYGVFTAEDEPSADEAAPMESAIVSSGVVRSLPPNPEKLETAGTIPGGRNPKRNDIRIQTGKLDSLMDLVGELVIGLSLVAEYPGIQGTAREQYKRHLGNLQKAVRNLQELALSMRMVPVQGIFQKMRRLVRDTSQKTKKPVELNIVGAETEVDKTVIEHLSDPLVHLIRNAIDHGFEAPQERRRLGKPDAGCLRLEAKHTGNEIRVMVRDDGAGLDREKIVERAVAGGLVTRESVEMMKDRDVWELMFRPGFSTRSEVSDLSGRGVGLDVVARNVNKINGRIDVFTRPGRGTLFVMKIPLTLSIIEGMVMRLDSDYFIIPTIEIRESLKLRGLEIRELYEGHGFVRLRDEFIPVFRMNDLFRFNRAKSVEGEDALLVIAEYGGKSMGVIVDEILGNQSVVLKSLDDIFGRLDGLAGCSILGNGEVSLILDVKELLSKFHVEAKLEARA